MYAYTAETGHTMNFAAAPVDASEETIAREMARRSFTGSQFPATVRDTYTATDHGIVGSGARRFTVTKPDGTETLTVFTGTREQVDALVW